MSSTPCPALVSDRRADFIRLFNERDVDRLVALLSPNYRLNFTAIAGVRTDGWDVDGDAQVLRRVILDRMTTGEQLRFDDGAGVLTGVLPNGVQRTFASKFAVNCQTQRFISVLIAGT